MILFARLAFGAAWRLLPHAAPRVVSPVLPSPLPRLRGRRAATGYSLIELLTVITIIAILTGLTVPQFGAAVATSSISANINSLTASFDLARSEALARNTSVIVCRTAAVRQATPSCSSASAGNITPADWASGWLIYAKPDANPTISAFDPSTDTLLRRIEPEGVKPGGDRILMMPTPITTLVGWTGNGQRASDPISPAPVFTVDYRDPQISALTVRARCLALSVTGRSRAGTC